MIAEQTYYGFLKDLNITKATYRELEDAIKRIKQESTVNRTAWEDYRTKHLQLSLHTPHTPDAIDQLFKDGLHIRSVHWLSCDARYNTVSHEILLKNTLQGYERDKAVGHEMAHALFDLPDGSITVSERDKENSIIAEWIGRQIRAHPFSLRAVILGLNLEPVIYDKASYLAFSEEPIHYDLQLPLPCFDDYTSNLPLRKVFMD